VKSIITGLYYPIDLKKLPSNWAYGYVGDFSEEIQPGFASGKHNQEGAGIPHLRPMNIDRQGKLDFGIIKYVSPEKDAKRLHFGDVLFNNTNSPELVGKTTVVSADEELAYSNHMTRVVFPDEIDSKYAAYQLHYLWMRGYFLHNCVKHVNQASVSSKALAKTVPFVVAPLEQQKSIVAEIEKQFSRLDEAVTNLKRVKANLKRYKAAVLKAAVEGKLTEEWRAAHGCANVAGGKTPGATKQHPDVEPASKLLERILAERRKKWEQAELAKMKAKGKVPKDDKWKEKYKEPAGPVTTDLPKLPEGWLWATGEQVSEFITKGTTPAAKKLTKGGGEVQFLKVYNLTFDGSLNHTYKPAFVSRKTHEGELARSKVVGGDVLINIVGPPLGQVSVVPQTFPEANINQAIARYRPVPPLGTMYLAYVLMAKSVIGWVMSRAKTTAGQSNLTLELCRGLPVPLAPIAEQQQIVTQVDYHISLVNEIEVQIDTNLKRAERLRQSILQKAFSGQLVDSNKDLEEVA